MPMQLGDVKRSLSSVNKLKKWIGYSQNLIQKLVSEIL